MASDSDKSRSTPQPKAFGENVLPTFTGKRPSSDPLTREAVPPLQSSLPVLAELASGVDALYLSGRAVIPDDLFEKLELARIESAASGQPVPFFFGDVAVALAPHAFLRYRYCLDHPFGRIGITTSTHLPAIRVQPRAEFLHGSGPRGAVEWFRNVLEGACGPVRLAVSRLDLFADFQGWQLTGDSRHEFVCRAKTRHTYEEDGIFNGLIFGSRGSGSPLARIYDKTIESAKTGSAYWKTIWGERFAPDESVMRIEFELGRDVLREYGVNTPEEVLDATGALWSALTLKWLTHRIPGADQTKVRWPISPEWECARRARVGEDDWGIARMYDGKRLGSLFNLMPGLVGYLASFGALTNSTSFADLLPHLSDHLARFANDSGLTLGERIALKNQKFVLP